MKATVGRGNLGSAGGGEAWGAGHGALTAVLRSSVKPLRDEDPPKTLDIRKWLDPRFCEAGSVVAKREDAVLGAAWDRRVGGHRDRREESPFEELPGHGAVRAGPQTSRCGEGRGDKSLMDDGMNQDRALWGAERVVAGGRIIPQGCSV